MTQADVSTGSIRKGYADGPFGQIHFRILEPSGTITQPDLYCLHPAPFSGLAFTNIMPHLAKGRRVIAPDYPGHGGSDDFNPNASIAEYAKAMIALVNDISGDNKADIMGFHTGNLVACEMTLVSPDRIGRIALIDIPAFDNETNAKYLTGAGAEFAINDDVLSLSKLWRVFSSRLESQGPKRAFEMFVEQLRHGKNMNGAFHAAFTYNSRESFTKLSKPAMVIATQSGLLEATRWAGAHIPDVKYIERLDITRAVLDEAAKTIAKNVCIYLDNDENH